MITYYRIYSTTKENPIQLSKKNIFNNVRMREFGDGFVSKSLAYAYIKEHKLQDEILIILEAIN